MRRGQAAIDLARRAVIKKKAQAAIEFVILFSVVLFLFLIFLYATNSSVGQKRVEKQNIVIKDIAYSVKDEIILAESASDGYQRTFEIPARALEREYNITLTGEFVYIYTFDNQSALALPIFNVTGQVHKGLNTIRKINGSVYVNT